MVRDELGGARMVKVEATVIRERVETVIDAVEELDGARRRDCRGGSRPRPPARDHARVPGPCLRVAIPAEGGPDVRRRRTRSPRPSSRDRRLRAERQRVGRRHRVDDAGVDATHNRTGLRLEEVEVRCLGRARDRGRDDLGRRRRNPRDVHAGRVRVPRGGPHANEERRPHRREERPHVRDLLPRLLPRRVRDRLRRRGNGVFGTAGVRAVGRRAARGRDRSFRLLQR